MLPIYENGDSMAFNDYKPIKLASVLFKLIENYLINLFLITDCH